MEKTIGLLGAYGGREKFMRTTAYAAMLVAGSTKGALAQNAGTVARQINAARTVLRLFDDLPMTAYTLKYGNGKQEGDHVAGTLGMLANIAITAFFPVEHIAWAADNKLLNIKSEKWWIAGVALWAVNLLCTILKSLKIISNIKTQKMRLIKQNKLESPDKSDAAHLEFKESMKNLSARECNEYLNVIKNSSDFLNAVSWLPKGFLWAGRLSLQQQGVFGTISSLVGLYQLYAAKK